MTKKPTYEELERKVKELEKESFERKRAEEALLESEERYRRITETITDYIYTVHVQNGLPRETIHGPACIAVTGYTAEEFKLNPYLWIQMVHEEDCKAVEEQAACILSGEKVEPLEHRIVRKDSAICWVRNTPVPNFDSHGRLLSYDGLIQDITERKQTDEEKKKLQSQFQHAQRMEAIGTLAGGIAHNFNNVLMGIQGNTSLILLGKTSDHPDYERLNNIEQSVLSGAELTKQLLCFARGGKYEVMPTDLNELIKTQNRMFGKTKKEITIRGKYQENPWTVEVDQGQINQVILNLYVNAWQAMPKGGDLYIQTENVILDENYTKPFNFEPGRYVKISITDTGVGMDEETQKRIFEPFFTTQEMGIGTGLGLASAYGIIKNHGGMINVYSEKGERTTFTIYLPASEKEIVKEEKVPEKVLKGTETVLLIDDENMIIDVGEHLLKTLGYKVLVARGGKEAIELYKKNQDTIDIVILDMIMPGVGGGKTYDRMKEINPNIKVLLSSGYSINGQATEILERGCDGFIQKPFNMKKLSKELRRILDS